MIKNNIFNYATSELSQDAFICYLASFAFKDAIADTTLNECARNMLHLFVPEIDADDVVLESIEQQFNLENIGRLDVLLTAQSKGKVYKIIVEDKTFTKDYKGQLINYKKGVQKLFPKYEVHGVFYKTGFQSNLSAAQEAAYVIITREKILEFLKPVVTKTGNQVIVDYYNYWKDFQDDVVLFSEKSIQNWNWKQIYGFYNYLQNDVFPQKNNYWEGYGYVANAADGFYGFWFGLNDDSVMIKNTKFSLYLQLEAVPWQNPTDLKICLKLSCESDPKQEDVRNARNGILYEDDWSYRIKKYHFIKPKRVVGAKYMTIGIFDGNYSALNELLLTINEAKKEYERLLDDLRKLFS